MTERTGENGSAGNRVTRRSFVYSTLAGIVTAPAASLVASGTAAAGRLSAGSERSGRPSTTAGAELRSGRPTTVNAADYGRSVRIPPNIEAVVSKVLRQDPGSLNTNWNGCLQVEALLHWSTLGETEGREFAMQWFADHRRRDPHRDDEYFHGRDSRVIRSGVLPISTYCGLYSLSFACHEIYRHTNDEAARQVCLDVADTILHLAARDRHGMVAHDDERYVTMAIPDVVYFAARALMIGSVLDPNGGAAYLRQAVYQIRTYVDIFLDRSVGLAKTMLTPSGLGDTYWTRASGWLIWALTGVLEHMPKTHPARAGLIDDLRRLADGVASVQTPNGALRALLDDPSTPEETSGTAMCIGSIHTAMKQGWLPRSYDDFVSTGWDFVRGNVGDDGEIRRVYTGWAKTAEGRKMVIDHKEFGWIPGVIMKTAFQLTS